jgi:RNA polymerase sigma-70 factor, ECF subfamily
MTLMTRYPRDEIVLHIPALRAFALSLTRRSHCADDLVQDTVERAWKNIAKFRPGTNLRAWMFTILRNCYYTGLRKDRREVPDSDGVFAARLVAMPVHDEALALRAFLVAFERLSAEHREVLTLVGAMGFSYDEAAEVIQVPSGTVKSRASRARTNLASFLDLTTGESLLPDRGFTMPAVMARAPSYAR